MAKAELSKLLLAWYAKNGRELPWRVKGRAHPNPYVILVSEFMLQQTGVKTVIPYFQRFMEKFPTVKALAEASEEEVYLYWQGLGYYSRARSLLSTARMIINDFGGAFPQEKSQVLKLKGIGEYTVASFLALAFNQPETVIDGNVIRVICRMYGLTAPVSEIMDTIRKKAGELTDEENPADYASAIMDLGAMICTPKKPQCLLCPWREYCQSKDNPKLESIPSRAKLPKKYREGKVYLIQNNKGEVLIRKRTEKGLLSGLYEFPWSDEQDLFEKYRTQDTGLEVSHVFTHFKLVLKIYSLKSDEVETDGHFVALSSLPDYAFSTLMRKVYEKANRNKILDI